MLPTTVLLLGLATAAAAALAVRTPLLLRRRARALDGRGPTRAARGRPRSRPGARSARAARRAVEAALPETADLLLVCLHAGLSVPVALRRAACHAPEAVAAELRRVNDAVALGTPVREALGAFADRTASDRVRGLVAVLVGGDRFGARLADTLGQWTDDLWTARRHEVETAARQAPVRILFPLVLLILPALLLTTVVPMLLATLRTLGS